MTKDELIQGYETEIQYQKHMIENLGRWFSLFFTLASIGFLLIYLLGRTNLPVFIIGLVLAVLGLLAMLVFGYGIYRGRINLKKVIDDFDEKLKLAQ